jgi:nucleoside-diphosphate-sugar epimerase
MILVTGASGNNGSELIKLLSNAKANVRDHRAPPKRNSQKKESLPTILINIFFRLSIRSYPQLPCVAPP